MESMNTNTCEIVQDLLPLYQDGVCSPASRALIDGHITTCPDCAAMLDSLRAPDAAGDVLRQETDGIIERQKKVFRRKSATAGIVTASILAVPVLICLIVNLAVGHGLSWFFIVLSALLLTASVTVLPMLLPRDRGLWTAAGFTASLLLLLGVCCLYTHGKWFFIAASGVLLGLSVCFLPFVLRSHVFREPPLTFIGKNKALIWMTAWTLFLVLLRLFCGLRTHSAGYTRTAFAVAVPLLMYAWAMFAAIRYLPGACLKTGVSLLLTGLMIFFADALISCLLGYAVILPELRLSEWGPYTVDGNVKWLALLSLGSAGLICTVIGVIRAARHTGK